jgi:hypothetical protein
MYGYDHKELTLTAAADTTITVELDFLADNTWSVYQTFSLIAGQTLRHEFPQGFHAHWVRVKSSVATTATAQFTYGPAAARDGFLDWSREQGLPTGRGGAALFNGDEDNDGVPTLIEFLVNGDTGTFDVQPIAAGRDHAEFLLRDLTPADGITAEVQFSADLRIWEPRPETLGVSPDQSGVPGGFKRMRISYPPGENSQFVRLMAR